MAFPDDALTAEEDVILHLHPHWRAAIRPVLVLLVALTALGTVWVMLPDNDGGHIGVAVVGAVCLFVGITRGVWPLLVWRSDHYVLTTERVLLQDCVLTRERQDLPLNRINDYLASQSLLDRMVGSGTLRLSSIGDEVVELSALPRVREVQTMLYELIETDRELHADDADGEPELPVQRRFGLRKR